MVAGSVVLAGVGTTVSTAVSVSVEALTLLMVKLPLLVRLPLVLVVPDSQMLSPAGLRANVRPENDHWPLTVTCWPTAKPLSPFQVLPSLRVRRFDVPCGS